MRSHRLAMALAAVGCASAALGACHHEPTFDERYTSAQAALHSEAAGIDAELAARESEAAAVADPQASGTGMPAMR